jgi:viroplasmin and RNaseH domain-containing protein
MTVVESKKRNAPVSTRTKKGNRHRPKYHAVSRGWRIGVFEGVESFQEAISGFPSPKYLGFPTHKQADDWLAAQLVQTVINEDEGNSDEEVSKASPSEESGIEESTESNEEEPPPPRQRTHRDDRQRKSQGNDDPSSSSSGSKDDSTDEEDDYYALRIRKLLRCRKAKRRDKPKH